jgi:preprotein translocase subunit SecD
LAGATSPTNQFAIVLDGKVISAPSVNEKIPNGSAEISGSFSQETANNLANVLKYGALPLAFEVSNVDTVSATLGGDQLSAGLIAGLIGLILVVVYSVVYYRGLAVVVFTSLVVAFGLTYTLIVLLGQSLGLALSLPGLAGAIVAIGVTADSFVIFFERVRDEAREGRSIRTAVETGWDKARRTIVVADAVSLLSAVILFALSIGTVKGFAFTLGLTTAVDLLMIFFFTKPVVSLLARTKFFGQGHRGSGFEAEHLGIAATRRPRPSAKFLASVKEA